MRRSFKVIIAGSRNFADYTRLRYECDRLLADKNATHNIIIISGTANGADKLGERYALEHGYELKRFEADWEHYGKSAGPIRNNQMAREADLVICFWNGKSKGTENLISVANKLDVELIKIMI